ncbi:hypothetical protein DV737_g4573, partial [Chaetothyriales sp. CBS 132003]
MSAPVQTARPGDEIFIDRPAHGGDSPTIIEPLRIQKHGSYGSYRPSSSHRATPPPQPAALSQAAYPYPDVRRVVSPELRTGSAGPTKSSHRLGSASSGRSAGPASASDQLAATRPGATLAERRGAAPKPLPDSPGPDAPDKEDLFQRAPQRDRGPLTAPLPAAAQQYFPPPSGGADPYKLRSRDPGMINRISSTASTSTTRATRGSPPPPETPIAGPAARPQTDIEARYAASGIAGTGTLNTLQAQSLAAQQRAAQYSNMQPSQGAEPVRRPWTPTEQPGSSQHPAPTIYQGAGTLESSPSHAGASVRPRNALENDMARLQVHDEPPPAYSQVPGAATGTRFPNDKPRQSSAGSRLGSAPNHQDHPAFANDRMSLQASQASAANLTNGSLPPASPPPLPEGWIAHLDPNSGQYYYIHLPTQATQWEFPKGPTPLNLNETPLSPTGSVFQQSLASPGLFAGGKPLASPGLPLTPGYDQTGHLSNPAQLAGPPPISGVELYKVQATNGVYFGPYLRYTNMDLERGLWLGSILLVTDAPQPPTIHIHQSTDLSPNPRQLKALNIATHQRWTFYKYEIDLQMLDDGPAKWTYAVTSHLGCTRYEFLVAGRHDTNWRFIATSGNDFTLNVSANERARLGGAGFMWKDIMQKHAECGGFHCQLGLGSQVYADRLWKDLASLKQWLAMPGKENRKTAVWTAAHEDDVTHAYFHYYTSHFDQPYLREAFAQIPCVLTIDDHDIFDGFGSYPEYMQFSNMFKNIGRIGIEMYLLFQHHTTLEILRNVSDDTDLFTITGTGWHFIKFLGPALAVVGMDTRSERNPHQVMAGPTYQGIFPKIALLPQSVQHCILMIAVPLLYPRLDSAEQIAQTVATGKKAVTGAYNMIGKVSSSVAGIVGAKAAVGSGFDSVKRAVGKSGLMGSVLSPFGDIDLLDELKDQWTHESKDLERTYLIRTLQGISHQRSIRFTFISGAVNTCGAGLVHDPSHPSDHKTMYQLISSSVVNTPPPSYVLKLLNSNKPLYIPVNGTRSTPSVPTDTKEDMLEIFTHDVTGQPTHNRRLMARRNYVAVVCYDPEVVNGAFGAPADVNRPPGRLSLAADFLVQGEGAYGNVVKFGPVVIPSLEYGR